MDPIVLAAGTALVSAMATDAWQRTTNAMVDLWRRARPAGAQALSVTNVGAELDRLRADVVAARDRNDSETEEALAGAWRMHLQRLLIQDPELAPELRRLLDEHLIPVLTPGEQVQVNSVVQRATVSGGVSYQAGRDIRTTASPEP
ncbi:hypothetical protein ACWCYL_31855 [Streptomyces sp. 900105755]